MKPSTLHAWVFAYLTFCFIVTYMFTTDFNDKCSVKVKSPDRLTFIKEMGDITYDQIRLDSVILVSFDGDQAFMERDLFLKLEMKKTDSFNTLINVYEGLNVYRNPLCP